MFNKVFTEEFTKIIKTTNSPLYTLCRSNNGLSGYYVKYISSDSHFDGLFAELICNQLAKKVNLKTPELNFAIFGKHVKNQSNFVRHLRIKENLTGIASQPVDNTIEVSSTSFSYDKHEFNTFSNPADILTICLFDQWIGNRDRLERNYNLLITVGRPHKIYVFDHFDAFLSISEKTNYKILPLQTDIFLGLAGSNFGRNFIENLDAEEKELAFNNFFNCIEKIDINRLISDVKKVTPDHWNIEPIVLKYIEEFLTDKNRIDSIKKNGRMLLY